MADNLNEFSRGLPYIPRAHQPLFQAPPLEAFSLPDAGAPGPAAMGAYLVTKFLEGVSRGRAMQAYERELQKANQALLLQQTLSNVLAAPIIPEEKSRLASELSQAMARLVVGETGKGGGKQQQQHPVVRMIRSFAEHALGPSAPKTMKPEEILNAVSSAWSVLSDPSKQLHTAAMQLESQAAQIVHNFAQRMARGEDVTREHLIRDLAPITSKMTAYGLPIPGWLDAAVKGTLSITDIVTALIQRGYAPGQAAAAPVTEAAAPPAAAAAAQGEAGPSPAGTPPPATTATPTTTTTPPVTRAQRQPSPTEQVPSPAPALPSGAQPAQTTERPPTSTEQAQEQEEQLSQVPVVSVRKAGTGLMGQLATAMAEFNTVTARIMTNTGRAVTTTLLKDKQGRYWMRHPSGDMFEVDHTAVTEIRPTQRVHNLELKGGGRIAVISDATGVYDLSGRKLTPEELEGARLAGTRDNVHILSDRLGRAVAAIERYDPQRGLYFQIVPMGDVYKTLPRSPDEDRRFIDSLMRDYSSQVIRAELERQQAHQRIEAEINRDIAFWRMMRGMTKDRKQQEEIDRYIAQVRDLDYYKQRQQMIDQQYRTMMQNIVLSAISRALEHGGSVPASLMRDYELYVKGKPTSSLFSLPLEQPAQGRAQEKKKQSNLLLSLPDE